MNKPLIAIVGPTASGKTSFSVQVAKLIDGEIICADSRTVYKGMDIGSAKPTEKERGGIKHHLLDIVEPGDQFSAAQFKQLADLAIEGIASRGKVPIIVGGTGLYVDAVIFDYSFGPKADNAQRTRLLLKTTEELTAICRQNNIDMPKNSTNKRHLIRAIELHGQQKPTQEELRHNTLIVGIAMSKEELLGRITKRTAGMVKLGILDEIRLLVKKYGSEHEPMTGNAYRIFSKVLKGELSVQVATELCIRSDMQLAKRQMTWFKRNKHIEWGEPAELVKKIEHFLSH